MYVCVCIYIYIHTIIVWSLPWLKSSLPRPALESPARASFFPRCSAQTAVGSPVPTGTGVSGTGVCEKHYRKFRFNPATKSTPTTSWCSDGLLSNSPSSPKVVFRRHRPVHARHELVFSFWGHRVAGRSSGLRPLGCDAGHYHCCHCCYQYHHHHHQ